MLSTHQVSQKALIREMDAEELEAAVTTFPLQYLSLIKRQYKQLTGKELECKELECKAAGYTTIGSYPHDYTKV